MRNSYFLIYLIVFFSSSFSLLAIESKKGELATKYGMLKYEIHYPEEKEGFANTVIDVLENKASRVINYFRYIPDNPVHFVINGKAEGANGSATVFPTNIVRLNDYPPLGKQFLASSVNWREALIIHELTHILTIGQLRGLISGVSYIFGSVVNGFAGVIPRWYAEGIAVWAESTFLDHGRLKNSQLISVTKNKLADPDFCSEIECLDTPDGYPYGSYAYWAGALFINYIETKKPGAIRCILKADSYSIPFYLNRAFKSCLGKNAEKLFLDFRNQIVRKKRGSENIDSQKGISSNKNQLYWVEGDSRGQYSKTWNYKSKESAIIELDEFYTGFAKRSWDVQSSKRVGPVILSAFGAKHYEIKNKKTKLLDEKSQYIFYLKQKKYLLLSYKDGAWEIKKWNGVNDSKLIQRLENVDIYNPQVYLDGERASLEYLERKLNKKERSLIRWDISSKSKKERLEIVKDLTYLDSCVAQNQIVHWMRKKNIIYKYVSSNRGFKKNRKYSSSMPILNLYFSGDSSILQLKNNKKKVVKMNCLNLEKELVKRKTWRLVEGKELSKNTKSNEIDKKITKSEKYFYPGLRHFRPYYWLLNFTSINNFSTWQASTVLSDPAQRHQVGLTAKYFPCLLYTSPSPRDQRGSRMPSSA